MQKHLDPNQSSGVELYYRARMRSVEGKVRGAGGWKSRPWRLGTPFLMLLTGCASQPAAVPGEPGFLSGLLHGFVAIAALAISLFVHVRIYAFPNGGFWYDAGFVVGFSASVLVLLLTFIARIGGFITR
jgi:hypothetical protein